MTRFKQIEQGKRVIMANDQPATIFWFAARAVSVHSGS